MFRKIYRELAILILLFLVGWLGFTYLRLGPEDADFTLSIEREQQLGDILAKEVLKSNTEVKSDTVNRAIFAIQSRLLSAVPLTEYDYQIHVIRSDDVNAFATLGGHIFVFTGMIVLTEQPEELAAVLAHEIGHVEKRHVVKRLGQEVGMSILFSILSGGDPVLISEIARTAVSTAFSRVQESEADEIAMETLKNSGTSPRYVSTVFRRIKEKYGDYDEHLTFLMSHPNLNSRIKKALEYPLDENFHEKPMDVNWAAVKRNL